MIYLRLIWSYLKIGFFGFGGGYAMLALIENEIVTPGWITEQMFTDIVAISQMTPGPIGINSATYIGYVAPAKSSAALSSPLFGILGSLICTLVVVLPSFVLVRYAGHYISRHRNSPWLKGIFAGPNPSGCLKKHYSGSHSPCTGTIYKDSSYYVNHCRRIDRLYNILN